VVMASIGHIRDLPRNAQEVPKQFKGTEAGRLGIDVENHFQPIYIVPKEKKSVVKDLKHALKNASELVLATDEDREGEAISWHVLEVLKPDVPMKRMVFHEITKHAIDDALGNWRSLDEKLIEAQEGRRVLDRLVGYELSPVLWKRVMPRLSAGRVQSVATRLIVERERARIAFRSASYWDLEGTFQADETSFPARLAEVGGRRVAAGRDFDAASGALTDDATGAGVLHLGETEARALVGALDGAEFRVASVESKAFTERPKPPFTTSTLQQEAGRKLRFSSAKTMAVAQRLYERGHITYMRTDSTNLSSEAVTAARQEIGSRFGAEYLPSQPRTFKSKVKNAQEAHEAIRPAGDQIVAAEALSDLDADERRVYELIWMRTLACQMSDARANRVAVRLAAAASNGEAVEFAASGKSYDFLGFRRAYVEDSDDPAADESESRLPVLAEGDRVECVSVEASDHATQPPARFTEASLVKELEEDGIGRPSTYASVIQTIQDRGYVWKKGSALVPTWTAFAVVQLLERHFDQLVDYKFTARMEEDLDVIARGEGESEKWLHSFYFGNGQRGLKELVGSDHLDEIDARSINTIPLGTDPNGRDVAVRVGRYGPYLQRDDDTVSLPDDLPPDELSLEDAVDRLERGKDGGRVLGRDPESGLDVIARDGRYGPYVQLGELVDGAEEKPKTASLLKAMTLDTMTLQEALAVLALPRVVGADAEGKEITVQNGRYGPYLKKGNDSRSLDTEEQIFTVTVAEAEALFAQPKRRRAQKPPIAELGPHPDSGALVKVLDGRYGPYATDGTTNATLPRGRDPESVTLEEAVALIREREARGPRRPRKTTKRTVKKRTPAKKRTSAKKRAPGKKRTRAKAPTETPVASGS
ncbi:MAG: type I DNA topoisomerase, partial [Acidimicrobiia bacterium]